MSSDGKESRKKKGIRDVADMGWPWWRTTIRQILYELIFSYSFTLVYVIALYIAPIVAISLGSSVFVALGAVLMVGLGIAGNPITIIALAIIRWIDNREEIYLHETAGWFIIKTLLKVLFSMLGAVLAGLTVPAIWLAALPPFLLPAQTFVPGSPFLVGFVVFLLLVFYYHVIILLSIHTEDGYGMLIKLGLAQAVIGIITFLLWQVVPNTNFTFATTTAAWAWSSYAGWSIFLEVVAAALVILLYYLLLKNVFSRNSRTSDGHSDKAEAYEALDDIHSNAALKNF